VKSTDSLYNIGKVKISDISSKKNYLRTLIVLGVVFGDIGTSPLYAFRECFSYKYGIEATQQNILGILSLIFWSLIIVISLKYTIYVMRADNEGEGGILALLALLISSKKVNRKFTWIIFALGIIGAALFYGDAMLTPAISVLSAVEGLEVASPAFGGYVIPTTLAILILFFFFQSRGTAHIGVFFGPIMLVWFLTLFVLGIVWVVKAPNVLYSLNPQYAVEFFINNKSPGFFVLGAVFLVVTGGEALYADMGHFGKIPIRMAWFILVLPSLLLNYFGQGALLLATPEAVGNSFYQLVPVWGLYPLIVLATVATIIASQAVVSGAFSLTSQALQLDLLPRVRIIHTSSEEIGQVYIPIVNWVMLAGAVFLVLNFHSSGNLASAYGVAIAILMIITTMLMYLCAILIWNWNTLVALALTVCLLVVDSAFFGANIVKLDQGGWFPFLIGAIVSIIIITWSGGRAQIEKKFRKDELSFETFLADTNLKSFPRVSGTAVYMTKNPGGVPNIMLHNIKHNKVLHKRVIILNLHSEHVPRVPWAKKLEVEEIAKNFFRVIAHYGFMETPNVIFLLKRLKEQHGIKYNLDDTTFFLGRTTTIIRKAKGIAGLKKKLFSFLLHNMQPATVYYKIPSNRVIEIGMQVDI